MSSFEFILVSLNTARTSQNPQQSSSSSSLTHKTTQQNPFQIMDSSSPQPNPSLPIEDDKPIQQHLSTPTKPPSAPADSTTHIDTPLLELPDSAGRRRRCKTRAPQTASPRNPRKPRRRFELEIREEKDSGLIEEVGKQPKKRRQTARTKKEKPSSVPPSASSPSMHFLLLSFWLL